MSIANELIVRGWTRGWLMNSTGEVCLMGAAICAYGFDDLRVEACDEVWDNLPAEVHAAFDRVIPSQLYVGLDNRIFKFNDEGEADDVLRAAKQIDELLDAS